MRYSQLLKLITPHKRTLFAIVSLLVLGTILNLLNPLIAGKLTETILSGADVSGFSYTQILGGWFSLLVLRSLLGFASSYMIGSTGAYMSAELRSRVYEHMQILPLAWYQDRKQGEILSLLSNDAESISNFVTNTLVQLLPLVLTFGAAFIIMAFLDPIVTLLAALMLPAYFFLMKILGRKLRPISATWIKSRSNMVALVNENLGLIPVIKAFNREPLESSRFQQRNEDLLTISKKQIWVSSLLSPAVGLLAGAGSLFLLGIAIQHVQNGQLTPAELVSLLLYILLLTRPMSRLASVYGQVMRTRGAAERLLDFFTEQAEPVYPGEKSLQKVRGQIEFREVSFAYRGGSKILNHFNLTIEAGETLSITGPNGSGKTTLVHLLMRFFEPEEGSIMIDGQDISDVCLNSLRDQIGLVAQHTLLLNGTVAENVTYGQPHADKERVEQALHAARADEFIRELPNGLDTIIGDQGIKLSGGQRQRLSLARMLLKDPPILILDEATAMFDPAGEAEFINECRALFADRTVILITHRPASLALADRIVEL